MSNQLADLLEKYVELLRAFAPSLQSLGLIWEPSDPGSAEGHKDFNAAAPRLGLPSYPYRFQRQEMLSAWLRR